MNNIHDNWRKFLTEGAYDETKLLQEVTEEELEYRLRLQECELHTDAYVKKRIQDYDYLEWQGWNLPKSGQQYADCGDWSWKGCLNYTAHADGGIKAQTFQLCCFRSCMCR